MRDTLAQLSYGDHCCLFATEDHEVARITAPFLALGLERGERCVYVGGPEMLEVVRSGLKSEGVAVDAEASKGRLILTSDQDYLDAGHWRTEKMLGFLQTAYDSALLEGHTGLRAAGDVSWQVGADRNYSDVVYYEALLDLFFIGKKMVGMCQYPKHKCPPELLTGILNTHKTAAVDGEVCSNVHYVPPDLLLEKDVEARHRKRADWMTSQLVRLKKVEQERDEAQSQLLQSQKMDAVGKLAGGVAHDFNNLLTAIKSFTLFALEDLPEDTPVAGDLQEVLAAADRAANLTRQLLTFARRQPTNPHAVEPNALVTSVEKLLRRLIGEDIDIATKLTPDPWLTLIDPGGLEQVLMNLAVNARDAMPEGGKLTIETRNVHLDEAQGLRHGGLIDAGDYVVIALTDSGTGMDAALQQRIFEPFFTTKEVGKGTGLGLSICYGIVRQAGGHIWVYSEPGHGSTFKIYLPRTREDRAASAASAATHAKGGSEVVLFVEDDAQLREIGARALGRMGYQVLVATGPEHALELFRASGSRADLLVSDVVMPGMSGHELARQLVALQPSLRTLFISGYSEAAMLHRGAMPAGAHMLDKPFTPTDLSRRVREVLDAA